MLTHLEMIDRVAVNEDFIALKRYDYSMKKLLERYPEGCPDRVIASALMMTEEEVEEAYQKVVVKLQSIIGVE